MPQKITIDDLARMVQRGFDETAKQASVGKLETRMDKFEIRMARFENRLAHTDARISVIERDIAEIRKEVMPRQEIENMLARLLLVEKKLGIKSGK